MARYLNLSYAINKRTPLYPGTEPVDVAWSKEIGKGDSCNKSVMTFSGHTGTHVEAPRHFLDSGRTIGGYALEELVFTKPLLLDCPKLPGEAIFADDLAAIKERPDADILLIRTGFFKYRDGDADIYCNKNPYLSPEAASAIRGFPHIRAVGVDLISISSHVDRQAGRQSHKILMSDSGFSGAPVLIIEDIRLDERITKIDEVIVAPLFLEESDASPCAVIGVIND